ncbi:MAG: thioesterase family protein [Deltaproteobacteria bacterium]|nr:thioesterase family protein [Deltaproteobacteria bacterium]
MRPPPGPQSASATTPEWVGALRAYHSHATEHRVVRESWGEIGPCTDWVRVRADLLEDTPLSAFARVAACADFGNGVGAALPFEKYRFMNVDLTVSLHRLPAGDWACLDAVTHPEASGVGIAESTLFDERGRLGRAVQSLLIEPR